MFMGRAAFLNNDQWSTTVCPLTCTSLHIKKIKYSRMAASCNTACTSDADDASPSALAGTCTPKASRYGFAHCARQKRRQSLGAKCEGHLPHADTQKYLYNPACCHATSFLPKDCARQIPYMLTHITSKKKYAKFSTHQGGPKADGKDRRTKSSLSKKSQRKTLAK